MKQEKRDYPSIGPARPRNGYFNISVLANTLAESSELLFDVPIKICFGTKKKAYTVIALAKNETLLKSDKIRFDYYDIAVMDAVYALISNGYYAFTPEMVVRFMVGDMAAYVTKQRANRVKSSISKLSMMYIAIDFTEEFNEKSISRDDVQTKISGGFMPVKTTKVVLSNGKVVDGYMLTENLAPYKYADEVGKVARVPIKVLSGGYSCTEENMLLRNYLIREIETKRSVTKKGKVLSVLIEYEYYDKLEGKARGIIPEIGYNKEDYSVWRNKRNNIRYM